MTRQQRIDRLARKLAERQEQKQDKPGAKPKRPLARKERKRATIKHSIAYDLETTSIKAGTPEPLYITAYSEELEFSVSAPIRNLNGLLLLLKARFLDPDLSGARFVGWYANHFDIYFIAASLLQCDDYILRPYLTKSKAVRGMRVTEKESGKEWEFLDGMAMTGIQKPLKDFLKVFAPDYLKLDAPDWENETFNSSNKKHVDYAFRDSEGLYYGLKAAEKITVDNFKIGLQPTIGNLGIKVFQSYIPQGIKIFAPPLALTKIVRSYVMRGGYCHCAKKYHGPVWKYDINQAYAAAMRECDLPAGSVAHVFGRKHKYAKCQIHLVNARNPNGSIPFYWRDLDGVSRFDSTELTGAWLTSLETLQLEAEKWQVEYIETWAFGSQFRMTDYVARLEGLRHAGIGGAKGAQGEMVKAVGNNSYGKTVETLDGLELILALDRPEGFAPYQDDDDLYQHIWARIGDVPVRDYHQPQIGAFITAHVRMVLRRAILKAPDAWLYADTDGIIFSRPVDLDIDPKRYGAWKQESNGEIFRLITKKVYANEDASEKHAKGVNLKKTDAATFENWFIGNPPTQIQIQRANFLSVMTGADMFFERVKRGQAL